MKETIIILVGVAFLALVLLQCGCIKRDKPRVKQHVMPPVDIDKPVENSALVTVLDAYLQNPTQSARKALPAELNKAVFLLPVVMDESNIKRSVEDPGLAIFEKDTFFEIFNATDSDGNLLLPIFTDWPSIRSWTKAQVSAMVLPAQDAWAFATTKGDYSGVVVNPGGHNIEIRRSEIEELKTE